MKQLRGALEEIARRLSAPIQQNNGSQQVTARRYTIAYFEHGITGVLTCLETSPTPIHITIGEGQKEHTLAYRFHPRRYADVRQILDQLRNALTSYLASRIAGIDQRSDTIQIFSLYLGEKDPFKDMPEFVERHVLL